MLTVEDQAILGRMSVQAEAQYRLADLMGVILTASCMRNRGSVVESITALEQWEEQLRLHEVRL